MVNDQYNYFLNWLAASLTLVCVAAGCESRNEHTAAVETNDSANATAPAVQPAEATNEPKPDSTLDTPTDPPTNPPNDPPANESSEAPTFEERLAEVEIPPAWLADVQTTYAPSHPWKEARLEIRRLLGLGEPESHREAIKLTWLYLQKDDMGDGHEYPMYTFLGGEPLWSIRAHEEFVQKPHENTPIHSYLTLASLYAQFGAFEKAKAALDTAMEGLPPRPWRLMRQADLADAYGDLYVAWDKPDEAKRSYAQAIETYPTAKPPYGGHLLARRAAKVQAKLDLLTFRSLATTQLKDGTYRDKALGYVGDINVTLVVQSGKIADIQLKHEEKIDQNACVLIPQRIIDQQSLQVDGISGATVTKDAIVNGVYRCLMKAGLQ